jgi:hypothetical protein
MRLRNRISSVLVGCVAVAGAALGAPGTFTITPPEWPHPVESDGNAVFQINRVNGSDGWVSVTCVAETPSGSSALYAQAGVDFINPAQIVTWGPGDTGAKSCSVPIINDSLYEWVCLTPFDCYSEWFYFRLQNPQGGASIASPGWVGIGIYDDD